MEIITRKQVPLFCSLLIIIILDLANHLFFTIIHLHIRIEKAISMFSLQNRI